MARHCPNPLCEGLARDGIVAEYEDSVSTCLDCGTRLIAGVAIAEPDERALEFNDLRTVFVATGPVQGQLVAGLIEAVGIPVYVKGEALLGAIGELAADVQQVEVQVPFERFDDARLIVDRFEDDRDFMDEFGGRESEGELGD